MKNQVVKGSPRTSSRTFWMDSWVTPVTPNGSNLPAERSNHVIIICVGGSFGLQSINEMIEPTEKEGPNHFCRVNSTFSTFAGSALRFHCGGEQ